MNALLDIRDVAIAFGGVKALDGVDLQVEPGTITSIFGANGAGKSTLFNILTGYLRPDRGELSFNGSALGTGRPVSTARAGIGRTWQSPRVFKDMSVLENLLVAGGQRTPIGQWHKLLFGRVLHDAVETKARRWLAFVGLETQADEAAGALSFGQQKLLSIAMLLMTDARLLVLDEPFAGLAPRMVRHISEVLVKLRDEGHSILLVEHNVAEATRISDQTFVLEEGRLKPHSA